MAPIRVIVHFNVKSEEKNTFRIILNNLKHDLPKVNGCNGLVIYEDHTNPQKFTLIESWDTVDAHKQHIENLIASGSWAGIAALLNGDLSSNYLKDF